MGLLSKLFGGDKDAEKAAKDLLNTLFGNASSGNGSNSAKREQESSAPVKQEQQERREPSPSGFSWGDDMPAEENQYNFKGTYQQYFEGIFSAEFSDLRYEKKFVGDGQKRIAYSFYRGGTEALVVELMSESCSAYKFRNDCKKRNVQYLRFYYDHDGWWNTRAYVVERMRKALNG